MAQASTWKARGYVSIPGTKQQQPPPPKKTLYETNGGGWLQVVVLFLQTYGMHRSNSEPGSELWTLGKDDMSV